MLINLKRLKRVQRVFDACFCGNRPILDLLLNSFSFVVRFVINSLYILMTRTDLSDCNNLVTELKASYRDCLTMSFFDERMPDAARPHRSRRWSRALQAADYFHS